MMRNDQKSEAKQAVRKPEQVPPRNEHFARDYRSPGFYSNQEIIRRNGGVRPQFLDDIGGCSANYR